MKNDENRIEERLLSNASLDELIRMKMEEEIAKTFEKSKQKPQKQVITDISKVPQKLIFSKFAVYKLFNKSNRTETFINGLQAEAMLGVQNTVRERIGSGKTDVFSTDSAYVKFEKVIIEV
jgi:hypothetical protein